MTMALLLMMMLLLLLPGLLQGLSCNEAQDAGGHARLAGPAVLTDEALLW
jgi:hypothetical protein